MVLTATVALSIRAERVFVGILEADSYQSVIYGASAFSRIADLPLALELANDTLLKNLAVPSLKGISPTDTLRIVQTADPAQPLSDENPANVAIIPLPDNGATILETFSAAYASRANKDPFQLFEHPKDNTNLATRVVVAATGHYLLTSRSRDALSWAWDNRTRLIDAPSQSLPGTLRVLVNPQRFADVLGTRGDKAGSVIKLDPLLRDFESLSFSIMLDGQALTFAVRGKPAAGSGLQSLCGTIHPPSALLWNGIPDNAFFASLSACDNPKPWEAYLGEFHLPLLRPAGDLAPQEAFTGERIVYLAPTKTGLCYVTVEPVKNAEAARQAIQKLHTVKMGEFTELVRKPARQVNGLSVESYEVVLKPPAPVKAGEKAEAPSLSFTIASLFLKQALLEATVANDRLITVLGPAHSLDGELAQLTFRDKSLTLNRRIGGQDPALSEALCLGASLKVADLIRHIVSCMPGVKPEQLRVLAQGGDGATFGITQGADKSLTLSLRIQSNEIAALQRMNRDGRDVLQDVFFQMFANQMNNLKAPAADAQKPKP